MRGRQSPHSPHPMAARRKGTALRRTGSRRVTSLFSALVLAMTLAIVALTQGTATAADSNGGVRIMPLGDSITDGYTPLPGGYRIGLWNRLAAGGYQVDFVGSLANGPAQLGDHDHEGHSGWRIDQLDANIVNWLSASDPRTIMLQIGTNDINQNYDVPGAPARLSTLIDHILTQKPQVQLFVAKITPESGAAQEAMVQTYNNALAGVVATKGPQVHVVDLHSALTTADLADGVHPNPGGYEKMAAVWYDALRSVPSSLTPLNSPASTGLANTRAPELALRG